MLGSGGLILLLVISRTLISLELLRRSLKAEDEVDGVDDDAVAREDGVRSVKKTPRQRDCITCCGYATGQSLSDALYGQRGRSSPHCYHIRGSPWTSKAVEGENAVETMGWDYLEPREDDQSPIVNLNG